MEKTVSRYGGTEFAGADSRQWADKGYQRRTNLVKDERDDLLAGTQNILNRRNSDFCRLVNVQEAGGVSQAEYRQQSRLCHGLCGEVVIGNLKRYKSPSSEHIP
jgi:hypothetical protein